MTFMTLLSIVVVTELVAFMEFYWFGLKNNTLGDRSVFTAGKIFDLVESFVAKCCRSH
jgi:hypothetical protein